jgi:hypothetical protein
MTATFKQLASPRFLKSGSLKDHSATRCLGSSAAADAACWKDSFHEELDFPTSRVSVSEATILLLRSRGYIRRI